MATHISAKIRIRRNQKQEAFNHSYLSAVRTWVKKVEAAILNKDKDEAKENFKKAEEYVDEIDSFLEERNDYFTCNRYQGQDSCPSLSRGLFHRPQGGGGRPHHSPVLSGGRSCVASHGRP